MEHSLNLRFVDLDKTKLTADRKEAIRELALTEATKIQRAIKNDLDLQIHIKEQISQFRDKVENKQRPLKPMLLEFED